LIDVAEWAENNVASVLCSCLATHALLKHFHGIDRQPMQQKRWGVFSHRISDELHPLIRDINTRFDVPHSRYNDISREQLTAAGLNVLAESADGGVHLAVSPDQARVIYFQGHPEYDRVSLLKEYKREVLRFASGERKDVPPFPENYFPDAARQLIEPALADTAALADILDRAVEPHLDNTWGDTAKAIINNWLGIVYQLTNLERTKQFMPDVDPDDPLNIRKQLKQK
ncbi:MAG: homoserine O-succinyltransferase, partial [Woeseiaceae bacterium]|nr:homoserine O-succinyltransferase [Woeseiaceae bacterium]